jgi:hypothetical protein
MDASVIPSLPSGNTHATCLMIGERGAQFLLDQARTSMKKSYSKHHGVAHSDAQPSNIRFVPYFSIVVAALISISLCTIVGWRYASTNPDPNTIPLLSKSA